MEKRLDWPRVEENNILLRLFKVKCFHTNNTILYYIIFDENWIFMINPVNIGIRHNKKKEWTKSFVVF